MVSESSAYDWSHHARNGSKGVGDGKKNACIPTNTHTVSHVCVSKKKSLTGKERNHLKKVVNPYEGAMSRWLMLKPDEANPPREEERVRKVTART